VTGTYADLAQQDLTCFPCLSKGVDSIVYRIGPLVAKEYQRLSMEEVSRYVSLQNGASDILRKTPYRATINLDGAATEIVADDAIRVDWLGRSRDGKPLTFSRFVEATNLEKLLWRPEMFEPYAKAELRDPELLSFAARLNAYFWNEYPTRGQDEFHYHVCMISRLLDRTLGCEGLYISKYNVKLLPGSQGARIRLVVTDLALYIERVRLAPAVAERSTADAD